MQGMLKIGKKNIFSYVIIFEQILQTLFGQKILLK